MSRIKRAGLLILCVLFITGCGDRRNDREIYGGKNSVDKTINSRIEQETESTIQETETKNMLRETEDTDTFQEKEDMISENAITKSEKNEEIDFDLTEMSSDIVYATIFQLMVAPEQYEGKTFKIKGIFYATYRDSVQKNCFYCIVQDAMACCAQGMEFVWGDGSHIYPDEYPEANAEVVVEGTLETYREDGDDTLYCRLANATLQLADELQSEGE